MRELDIRLNELAQGLRPLDDGAAWFDGLSADEQSAVLSLLCADGWHHLPTA